MHKGAGRPSSPPFTTVKILLERNGHILCTGTLSHLAESNGALNHRRDATRGVLGGSIVLEQQIVLEPILATAKLFEQLGIG